MAKKFEYEKYTVSKACSVAGPIYGVCGDEGCSFKQGSSVLVPVGTMITAKYLEGPFPLTQKDRGFLSQGKRVLEGHDI